MYYENFYGLMLILHAIAAFATIEPSISFDPTVQPFDLDKDIVKKQSLPQCRGEESINLSNSSLWRIPRRFVRSNAIREIDLSDNKISTVLSDAFADLPTLECLNLAGNHIPPDQLMLQHDGLETLIMDDETETSAFSEWESSRRATEMNLPNLKNLSWRKLTFEITDTFLRSFPLLSTLRVSDSRIRYVNDSFTSTFYAVKNLHLEENYISDMTINSLQNLEELYLDGNPLETGNAWITAVSPNLRVLSLSNCKLSNLLNFDHNTLRELDLSRNAIRQVNQEMLWVPFLESLSLSRNELPAFPSLQHLERLRSLSLSYNSIKSIEAPIRLPSLISLNLRGNGITDIGKLAFSELYNLQQLDLSENRLQWLPDGWCDNLNALHDLSLSRNFFSDLKAMSVRPLVSLNNLLVKDNYFVTIGLTELQHYVPKNCIVQWL